MTEKQVENLMKKAIIEAYNEVFGSGAFERRTAEEQTQILHLCLVGFCEIIK